MTIEKKLILIIIYNQDAREEIFEQLGEEQFGEEKISFKLIKDMYIRNPSFTEVEAITTLKNLISSDNNIRSKEVYGAIRSLRIKDLINELKKKYSDNKLYELERDIKVYIESGKDISKIIQHINTSVGDIEGRYYVKPFYKLKKENEIYIDNSTLAEWIISRYHIYNENNEKNNFRIYDNGVYRIIEDNEIKQIIYKNLDGKFKSDPYMVNKVLEIIKYAGNEFGIKRLNLEENINFKNCILNVRDGIVIEHTPKLISNIQMNVNYNKDAKCPKFVEWIEGRFNNIEDIRVIQEIMGYLMVENIKARKFFIIHGASNSGKSTLLKIINDIIGENNISSIEVQRLEEQFKTAHLKDKIANIFDDIPASKIKENSIIKALVSGTPMNVEFKYKDCFEFKNKARLLFTCNELPISMDRTTGYYNRCLILSMDNVVDKEKIDVNLTGELLSEKSGIVNWAVEGLKRLMENGYNFTSSTSINENITMYKDQNDSLQMFIDENCKKDDDLYISMSNFKSAYSKYCDINRCVKIKDHLIRQNLIDKGYKITKKTNVHCVTGLSI